MLRLPHRILSQSCSLYGLEPPATIGDDDKRTLKRWVINNALRNREVPVIVADNVAAYLDGTYVKWSDVEPIAPPFPKMLVTWRNSHYKGCCEHGVSLETTVVDDLAEDALDAVMRSAFDLARRFGLKYEAVTFDGARPQTPSPSCIILAFSYYVDIRGNVARAGLPAFFIVDRGCLLAIVEPRDLFASEASEGNWARPALTAVALMNCKNVNRLDVTKEQGPLPRWCRRQRVPELAYHTLQIDPNAGRKPRPGERETAGDRSGKALHICRGHFAHFIDDGVSQGLFGRGQFGTFWVPSHTRGSLEHGRVVSTYQILAPQQ